MTVGAVTPAAGAGVLDQEQAVTSGGWAAVDNSGGTLAQTQTFTAGRSGPLERISLYIGCCADVYGVVRGTPPGEGVFVDVEGTTADGTPDGRALAAAIVPASRVSGDGTLGWVDIPLKQRCVIDGTWQDCAPGSVAAGQRYAIVVQVYSGFDLTYAACTPDGEAAIVDCGYQWGRTTPGDYPGGTALSLWGGVWYPFDRFGSSSGDHDFAFRTFVAEATGSGGDPAPAADTVPPTGTVVIDDGASSTRTRSATLTLNASDPSPGSGVTRMRLAETGQLLLSAVWEPYAARRSWMLSSGKGTKTVYVQFQDGAGNISAVAQDTITLR